MDGTAGTAEKPIIGLAGGIGAGKSTVAAILQDLGAGVVSSDRLNHEELGCPEVRDQLRSWWGETVITPDGQINRDAIRDIVSRDAEARHRLEQLVHPRIARRREALIAQYNADPRIRATVLDSPLLFETGLADRCSDIIFVDTELEVREARVASTRGWQPEELLRLEKAQKPLDFKRDSADHRVVNNSDVGDLRRQVEKIFSRILSGA